MKQALRGAFYSVAAIDAAAMLTVLYRTFVEGRALHQDSVQLVCLAILALSVPLILALDALTKPGRAAPMQELRDFVFSCPHCGVPFAQTVEPNVDIHAGATYTCSECKGKVIFEAVTPDEYVGRYKGGQT